MSLTPLVMAMTASCSGDDAILPEHIADRRCGDSLGGSRSPIALWVAAVRSDAVAATIKTRGQLLAVPVALAEVELTRSRVLGRTLGMPPVETPGLDSQLG